MLNYKSRAEAAEAYAKALAENKCTPEFEREYAETVRGLPPTTLTVALIPEVELPKHIGIEFDVDDELMSNELVITGDRVIISG